jgi:hypothetical protein
MYDRSVNCDANAELATIVTTALLDLLDIDSVTRIVFIYLNHGDTDCLRTVNEKLQQSHFLSWAALAVLHRKHLLFVLGACDSTVLAEELWLQVGAKPDYPRFVGFLTSGRGDCMSSAILISRDATLVDPFDANADHTPGQIVQGFRIDSSMFARQFLWLWAYGKRALTDSTLGRLPELMNHETRFRLGFHAGFLRCGTTFAAIRVRSFFPVMDVKPTDAIRDANGLTFGQVIPGEAVEESFANIGRFWGGTRANYPYRYVEIAKVNGEIQDVKTGNSLADFGENDPIYQCVHGRFRSSSGSPQDIPDVPLDIVYFAFIRIAQEEGLQWTLGGLTSGAWDAVKAFLVERFGEIPGYITNFLSRLAEARCDVDDPEKYWVVLGRACEEVKNRVIPPPPGAEPEQAAPGEPE